MSVISKYSSAAIKLESDSHMAHAIRMSEMPRTIHALIGLQSEVGELADAVKKRVFRGDALDKTNILEECGDILWYLNLMVDSCGSTLDKVMHMNIAKLEARYKERQFKAEASRDRDVEEERKILEQAQS